MTVALLSDIHSNYYAFKACYEDTVKCGAEMFIFLGDYVSDLSEPQRTMDLVYEIQSKYPTVCLRGNREGYMLDCKSGKTIDIKKSFRYHEIQLPAASILTHEVYPWKINCTR